ncbi:MAG: hypothetical protein ABI042_15010 [Verrucomicrobiota bacterium]
MTASNLNFVALLFLFVAGIIILKSTKENATKALLATAIFVPLGQQFVVLGLHLYFSRILILLGFVRVMLHSELVGFHWNTIDKFFVSWAVVEFLMPNVRGLSFDVLIGSLGTAYNSFGIYFLLRFFIKDFIQVVGQLKFLCLASVILAIFVIPELVSGKNPFSFLGGVPPLSEIREGRIRCQGPFRHSILLGTFAATLLPLMVGLWFQSGRDKGRALAGALACAFVVYASGSSGPLLSVLLAALGLTMWPIRHRMGLVRKVTVVGLIGLAFMMKAPIWYIIDRISGVAGGSGWHRSYLIDQAVQHFNEWWLLGTSVTAHWAPFGMVLEVDPNNMDITNHYIAQGIGGGIVGLMLFIGIIVYCFKLIGFSVNFAEQFSLVERKLIWTAGVSLTAHCAAFISVAYFDQIQVFWFWLLAIVSCITSVPFQSSGFDLFSNDGEETNFKSGEVAPVS